MQKIYASYAKDNDIINHSSSGGLFTVLSDYFLEKGDAVVASCYDYNSNLLYYKICTTKEERNECRGSKYFQAKLLNIHLDMIDFLRNNINSSIFFVGTPCQVASIKKIMDLKGFHNRIVYCDLICHGVPSAKIFEEYINSNNKTVKKIEFKDKTFDWGSPYAYAIVNNRKVDLSDYVDVFNQKIIMRPSCYTCMFAKKERYTDFTIGDFWGANAVKPDFYNKMGTSCLFINTDKGEEIFESVRSNLYISSSNYEECIKYNLQPSLVHPPKKPENREEFWAFYEKYGSVKAVKKFTRLSFSFKLKRKIKYYLKHNRGK